MAVSTHWQDNAKNLSERVCLMWKNKFFTDHTIKVCENDDFKEFKVNKIFLAIASPYFEGLFYGSFNNHSGVTEIKDINPELFEQFLRYIYTDKLDIKSFDDGQQMYKIADRFLMPELQKLALSIIRKDTNLLNICQAYEFYKFYNMSEALKSCEEAMTSNTLTVIESPRFTEIEKDTLLWILKQNELAIESEIDIYNAAIKWIQAEEERAREFASNEHNGEWWSEIIHNIRFLGMTPQEFSLGPAIHHYISKEDKLAFLTKLSCVWAPIEYPEGYSTQIRSCSAEKIALSADKIEASEESDLSDDGNMESITYHAPSQRVMDSRLPTNWKRLIYDAAQSGDMVRLAALYQQGAEIDTRFGKNRRTLLHVSATAGKIQCVRWLIDHGVDVDARNRWGWTPLHFACREGHVQVVRFLLSFGADSTLRTCNHKSIYDVACEQIKDLLDEEYAHLYFPVS